ncbi:thioredoxin family protein [Cocleimonas flava]|uniref:AhpC/TSA family protein n=1 Tax=Cocleimonas flava TaxID=634765 RepID=A0A4R1F8H3_9GAMM|nr:MULTISPECIES: thioredoxin family protein [Cocleimonas]MEB8431308.1 thioredoxin family protein [Cocleimonas sp. KMM 6892]MEC4713920.1 thioredoxin family protein [Cocleimonas sp. KMM 6895]MEC4743251.1 thioredoxin family protein [Cocleimonas sp. KMM 6896]TCJ88989.1 AhpC/TSA family protein [Cocleimonas flava]
MAATPSTMLELGTQAPDFSLIEPASGNMISLSDFKNEAVLVAFISNHCPYVILIKDALAQFARDYQDRGLKVIAINANDVENYPDDSPEKMVEDVEKYDYTFPYLFDESQQTATAYQASCTPDFFLFDANHKLYYRGQFDGARPNSEIPVTGEDMIKAAESLLAGEPQPVVQKPSMGCNIKWKAGNEPQYT